MLILGANAMSNTGLTKEVVESLNLTSLPIIEERTLNHEQFHEFGTLQVERTERDPADGTVGLAPEPRNQYQKQ